MQCMIVTGVSGHLLMLSSYYYCRMIVTGVSVPLIYIDVIFLLLLLLYMYMAMYMCIA